jgi:tetratricopeptide (TPR) repeat protein
VINLLLAIAAGIVVFLAFLLSGIVHTAGAILPGVIATIVAFVLLARRTGKLLEAVMADAQKEMMARKPERAVAVLEGAFKLARWQFGVAASLHANVGVLLYVQQKFDEAEPHLRKAGATLVKMWQAQAMLACILYRQKKFDEMEKVFDGAIKAGKNDTLSFAVYAYCERERGEKKKALEILQKGLAENASDEKLKALVNRAQNDKRYKLDAWGEQWWQFWLEKPPMLTGQQSGGFAFTGRQRFGRGGYRR